MRFNQAQITQPLCIELFPYQETPHNRSRAEFSAMAAQQQEMNYERRKDFLKRFEVLKATGDSIRSFPADLRKPFGGYEMPPAPRLTLDLPITAASHHLLEEVPIGTLDDYSNLCMDDDLDGQPTLAMSSPRNGGNSKTTFTGTDRADQPQQQLVDDSEGIDWSNAKTGVVRQVGRYRYKFDQKESMSYLVRLGQHNYVWGIDLERVVNLHGIKRGDRISLKCVGKQPVEIEVDEIQPDQSVITIKKWVERNTWVAKVHQRAPEPPQDK